MYAGQLATEWHPCCKSVWGRQWDTKFAWTHASHTQRKLK